ncbi:Alpha/Beta hydrolase protein [Lipomyces oligophaga]|uniref:Alpha/Beta hydrolase protein n=1 Tax=Lipomyces oligophaga TaxID=45792 RepID=UPI0034CF9701
MSLRTGLLRLKRDPRVKLYYRVAGVNSSDAKTIVLSNSLSSACDVLWKEFEDFFGSKYRLILYDQRFHGNSPLIEKDSVFDYYGRGLRFEQYADDVVELLDHLGVARAAALVGLSMGATTAVIAMGRHGDRFDRIIAAGSGLKSDEVGAKVFEERVKFVEMNGMSALAPLTMARWFPGESGASFLVDNPGRASELTEMLNEAHAEGLVSAVRALQHYDLTTSLECIRRREVGHKVLLIAGSEDGPLPVVNSKMSELGGTGLAIIKGSGHLVNIQRSTEFNRAVDEFLASDSKLT